MANLTDSYNITLYKQRTFQDRCQYWQVPAFGDGNCALNGFALWMVDAIKRSDAERSDIVLDKDKQTYFMFYLYGAVSMQALRERLHFYRGEQSRIQSGNPYTDVADELEKFINFLSSQPTFANLYQYIKDNANTRHQIAALQVGLAPALRHLGVDAYLGRLRQLLGNDGADDMIRDAISLYEDGENCGQEVLGPLAKEFFGVNLALYEESRGVTVNMTDPIPGAPTVCILHTSDGSGHFDLLLLTAQVDKKEGLASCLQRYERPSPLFFACRHNTMPLGVAAAVFAMQPGLFARTQRPLAIKAAPGGDPNAGLGRDGK